MSVEHPDIQYLKSDEVGRVIAQGLAELYRVKPEFPLDYLSKWLYNYSSQQEAMKKLKEEQKRTKLLVEDLQRDKVTREEKENILRLEEETKVRKVVSFEEYIENYEYPDELVGTFFPQGIYDLVENLTAAYVAFYEFRKKDFDALENDDETAHLDFNLPKVIQYVGGDNGTAVSKSKSRPKQRTGFCLKEQASPTSSSPSRKCHRRQTPQTRTTKTRKSRSPSTSMSRTSSRTRTSTFSTSRDSAPTSPCRSS